MQATKRNFVMKSEISPVPRGLKSQYYLPFLPCHPAPQNAVLCPKIWQLLSLEDFLLLPCFFSSILSFSIKHTTPQKKRRLALDNKFLLFQLKSSLSTTTGSCRIGERSVWKSKKEQTTMQLQSPARILTAVLQGNE